ncbi:MAG: hypothetical protein RRA92_06690, partial [Gemmatimonadota bacterium]|nr:hypothetical protein [Gemmatimonadota bacterium]
MRPPGARAAACAAALLAGGLGTARVGLAAEHEPPAGSDPAVQTAPARPDTLARVRLRVVSAGGEALAGLEVRATSRRGGTVRFRRLEPEASAEKGTPAEEGELFEALAPPGATVLLRAAA